MNAVKRIFTVLLSVAAMIVVAIINVIEKICVKWRKEL